MVSVSTLNTDNGKISCETPGGTQINININQRSILDCLLDTIQALRTRTDQKISGMVAKPSSVTTPALRLGLGASMMSMGSVSFMLAVIFYVVQPDLFTLYHGTLFWVGIPFIISGALNIVACRHPNAFWESLVFVSVFVSFTVSIAGLAMAADDQRHFSWTDSNSIVCDNLQRAADRSPRNYYNSDWALSRCRQGFHQYETLLSALVIMTQLLMIWGICLSILSLGCRLKALYSICTCGKPAEEQDDSLLPPNPAGEIFTV